jgi:hypothetical protein
MIQRFVACLGLATLLSGCELIKAAEEPTSTR